MQPGKTPPNFDRSQRSRSAKPISEADQRSRSAKPWSDLELGNPSRVREARARHVLARNVRETRVRQEAAEEGLPEQLRASDAAPFRIRHFLAHL